jgi:hypothetical protein
LTPWTRRSASSGSAIRSLWTPTAGRCRRQIIST